MPDGQTGGQGETDRRGSLTCITYRMPVIVKEAQIPPNNTYTHNTPIHRYSIAYATHNLHTMYPIHIADTHNTHYTYVYPHTQCTHSHIHYT